MSFTFSSKPNQHPNLPKITWITYGCASQFTLVEVGKISETHNLNVANTQTNLIKSTKSKPEHNFRKKHTGRDAICKTTCRVIFGGKSQV